MCNHKPTFANYYFKKAPNPYSLSSVTAHRYTCKRCGEQIGLETKYVPFERFIGISKYIFPITTIATTNILILSCGHHFSQEVRLSLLIAAFIAHLLLDLVMEIIFYRIARFKAHKPIEEKKEGEEH